MFEHIQNVGGPGAGAPKKIGPTAPNQVGASAPRTIGASDVSSTQPSVAFQALLDELANKARELEQSSLSIAGPKDLAGAVGRAEVSLHEALSLGDRLLEAYRQALQQPQPATKGEGAPKNGGTS